MAEQQADREHESNPGTEPFVPDFDTGEPSVPFVPNFDDDDDDDDEDGDSPPILPAAASVVDEKPAPAVAEADGSGAAPVAVPGRYVYLKWWKFVLVLLGVWFFAAVFGLSLYYWWYHDLDKTPSEFVVFGYVVACTVAGPILATIESKPVVAALAIAVMSAPFASVGAAAPLYGYFYCERTATPCVMGIVPE